MRIAYTHLMPVAGFDICINGVRHTFHDVEKVAIQVAMTAKQKRPDAVITLKSTVTGEERIMLADGRLA
jgi:hypothetical protein